MPAYCTTSNPPPGTRSVPQAKGADAVRGALHASGAAAGTAPRASDAVAPLSKPPHRPWHKAAEDLHGGEPCPCGAADAVSRR